MSGRKKREIRDEMRRVTHSLDPRWLKAANAQVCTNLSRLVSQLGNSYDQLLAWAAFFPGEIDLTRFIDSELDRRLSVYLPRVVEGGSMTFISISKDWLAASETGVQGIPQPLWRPESAYSTDSAARTVVLIPGLAFDRQGNRIGRGKGYYDRFMSRPNMKHATKIGLCWSLQLIPEVPADSHDVIMDWVCTEDECLRTGLPAEAEV